MTRKTDWSKVQNPDWACKKGICAHPACLNKRMLKLMRQRERETRLLYGKPPKTP